MNPKFSPRKPLALSALLTFLFAVWGGLVRLQWRFPLPQADWISFHGPLMVSGFFGTVIGLARAGVLKSKLGFKSELGLAVPLAAALGAWTFLLGGPEKWGIWCFFTASLGYLLISAGFFRIQPFPYAALAFAGGVGWAWAHWMWLHGLPIPQVVTGWMGFLVLTIVSERLEAARWKPSGFLNWIPVMGAVLMTAGMLMEPLQPSWGVRVFSAGGLGLALSMVVLDAATAATKHSDWRGFLKACLYASYGWLLVSSLVGLAVAPVDSGFAYDAFLHSVFLGLVFTMVFSHAPLLLPRVLKTPIPFHPVFYSHWILLQGSVLLRLSGDALSSPALRRWGALLNALALLLFLFNTIWGIRRGRQSNSEAIAKPISPPRRQVR
jgi:hypothetical protein